MMKNKRIHFEDKGPDHLGRRFFTLLWTDSDGIFRKEIDKDGKPVGYRRGQCFFADPKPYLEKGYKENDYSTFRKKE